MYFDFDSGNVESAETSRGNASPEPPEQNGSPPPLSTSFVGDILERTSAPANPPSAPTFKPNTTGFPEHKKRMNRVSAFKQQRAGRNDVSFTSQDKKTPVPEPSRGTEAGPKTERERIDEENKQRLAEMSAEEIEQERKELLSMLSPSLVEKLLKKSDINDASNEKDWDRILPSSTQVDEPEISAALKPTSAKKVSFDTPSDATKPAAPLTTSQKSSTPITSTSTDSSSSEEESQTPAALQSESATQNADEPLPEVGQIHFPTPPQPPPLDPSDPNFLKDLHDKYFPSMPYDPASMSWMTPIDPSDTSSPYHPSKQALNASELRFDFKGTLLAPNTARNLPTNLGLHHHADAPEAAGYTIPELAVLARSQVAAQRCVAYQTLGRILYRLGKGEFGREKESRGAPNVRIARDPNQEDEEGERELEIADTPAEAASAMATGLWNCVAECKVLETLNEEAAKERGHLTARTFAQEALWNWRRGGGRKRGAV